MVWHTLKIGALLVKMGLFWICEGALKLSFGLMLGMDSPPSYPCTLIFRLFVILFMLLDGIKWLITRFLINWDLFSVIDGSTLQIGLLEA